MTANPKDALATMAANLRTLTGRSLVQWTALARKSGPDTHGKLVAWLKSTHSLSHGYANRVALETLRSSAAARTADGADLIDEMFSGPRQAIRPLFDAVMKGVRALGTDIEYAPKKGYVSLRRSKQFATVHASTADRIDIGLKLPDTAATGRLEAAGSWNGMVTHRVRLSKVADVDRTLLNWLRAAYERS